MRKSWITPDMETLNLTQTMANVKDGTVPDGAVYSREDGKFIVSLASGSLLGQDHWDELATQYNTSK